MPGTPCLIAVSMTVAPTSPSTVRAVPSLSMKVILTISPTIECCAGLAQQGKTRCRRSRRGFFYRLEPDSASTGAQNRSTPVGHLTGITFQVGVDRGASLERGRLQLG